MTKHKVIKLNMRPYLLDRLLFSYFSGNAPTRATVSESCEVSKVTSGKVARALIESKIMCERVFSLNGESPCAHLFIEDNLNVMVIDLSSSTFKMTLFDANANSRFKAIHNYDTAASFDDNINIFLSRCGLKAKQSGHSFSAISVIYADDTRREYLETIDHQAILPSINQKDKIAQAVYSLFHKKPISHLTVSEAISEAIKFGLTKSSDINNGISYIHIGNQVSSFHIHANGSITVCQVQNILSNSEKQMLNSVYSVTKEDIDLIFIRLSKFMTAAFSPSVILLESEYHLPDGETARKLTREFTIMGINPPIIQYKNDESLFILGAIRCSVYLIAKRYLIP